MPPMTFCTPSVARSHMMLESLLHLGIAKSLPHSLPACLPKGCPIPLHLPAWPPVGLELVGLSGVGGWGCGAWIGKKWLSPCLINDPSVACPATLGPHVSTSVHAGRRALFWEEMVSAPHDRLTIKRNKEKKRFTVIKGEIKAHNGNIDFFFLCSTKRKKKKITFGKSHSRSRREI